eukprot:jgi/Hompol1/4879/HPOL_003985-RA
MQSNELAIIPIAYLSNTHSSITDLLKFNDTCFWWVPVGLDSEFTGLQRVFQSIPRYMRRRAASHNVKRLPSILRQRAIDQIARDDNPPKVKKKRYKKRKAASLREEFLKRPAHNKWLETHVWHAKRMTMCEKWGYILADHPNDKSARASYRACKHTSIVHDASYIQPIQLSGSQMHLIALLRAFLDPTMSDCAEPSYLSGDRQLTTFFHRRDQYPDGTIGKVQIMWQYCRDATDSTLRNVWIWAHPQPHREILELLDAEIRSNGNPDSDVQVKSLKGEFVRFELNGPRSHAILAECFKLCSVSTQTSMDDDSQQNSQLAHDIWNQLKCLTTPTALPPGVVLGLVVHDPRLSYVYISDSSNSLIHAFFLLTLTRLKQIGGGGVESLNRYICRFPVKMPSRLDAPQPDWSQPNISDNIVDLMRRWPEGLSASDIWNHAARETLLENRLSDKQINERRSAFLIPGTRLDPLESDSQIPVLLVHRASAYSLCFNRGECTDGWDLILPRGWAMDFWLTLVFAGARTAGLREKAEMHFEDQLPYFPTDYPESPTFVADSHQTKRELSDAHNRKPAGKRLNYASLQVASPFELPFQSLLGIQSETASDDPITVLHSPSIIHRLNTLISDDLPFDTVSTSIANHIVSLISKRRTTDNAISVGSVSSQIDTAFVRVSVKPIGKGSPKSHAILYSPTLEQVKVLYTMLGESRPGFSVGNRVRLTTHVQTHDPNATVDQLEF